jgi:hypothetical protein
MKTNTEKTFDFLIQHAKSGETFSAQAFSAENDLDVAEAETLLNERLQELVKREGENYRTKPEILRVRRDDFKELLEEKKRLFSNYLLEVSPSILIYEFFMPLSREDRLREALDNLFYRDTIEQRIHEIGIKQIRTGLKLTPNTAEKEVRQIVFDFIQSTIGGYSIYLVNGRYRADLLASRAEVLQRPFGLGAYIVDETTAIVRFILPVETEAAQFVHGKLLEPAAPSQHAKDRAEQIRWLFLNFFAEALIRVVPKEDEIWLLESGMRSAFYRWVKRETV